MELDPDQKYALEQLEAGKSIFLTGGAGSGKSAVLKRFLDNRPGAVSMAPTSAAAHLIGGTTVHRFMGLPVGVIERGQRAHSEARQRLMKAKVLVFDEVSMLRIDHLQAIRDRLFSAARGYGDWAGYQVVMSGDFAQLPPVLTDREQPMLEKLYGKDQLFGFQSRIWGNLTPCTLTHLHRQADDLAFAQLLKTMREGRIPDLAMLDSRVGRAPEQAVRLVASNRQAEAINRERLDAIPGGVYRIQGAAQGAFNDNDMRVPTELRMKPGARVILCANDPDGAFHNGSTGIFLRAKRDERGRPEAEVQLDDGREVTVKRHVWDAVDYEYDERTRELNRDVVGRYTQLPILPGWAITIHRSQGMTLPNMHLDPSGIFAPGQLYVGLSRAPSLAGLSLAAPVTEGHVLHDHRVRQYQSKLFGAPELSPDETPIPA